MKYIYLILFLTVSSNADMLFNNDRCITAYATYSSGTKYKVKYSSNPTVFVKTGLSTATTAISQNIYILKYDDNNNELCLLSKAKELGMSEQDYNFTMSLIGGLFGFIVLSSLVRII